MAIPIQPLQANREYLLGLTPTTSSGGASFGGGGAASAPNISQGTTQTAPTGETSSAPYPGGADFFGSGTKTLQGAQGDLSALAGEFRRAAGPSRNFESAGGTRLLNAAIQETAAPDTRAQAKGLVNAIYGGPAQLDSGALGKITQSVRGVSNQAQSLLTGEGIASNLSQSIGGITPGEAAFESRRLRYDPGFRQQAFTQSKEARDLEGRVATEEASARNYAQERSAQEADIAKKSRDYLGSEKQGILGAIDVAVGAKKQQNAEMQGLFDRIQKSGNLGDLPDPLRQKVAGSAGRQESAAAQAEYNRILGMFPDLAGYDPLERIVTGRGREWFGMPSGRKGTVKDLRQVPGVPKEVERRLVERQRLLEALFGADLGRKDDKDKTQFRDVAPLYDLGAGIGGTFNERVFQPLDFRAGIGLQQAQGITPESLASQEQRDELAAIAELLGETGGLAPSDIKYQEAALIDNLEPYLEQEEQRLAERADLLDQAESGRRKKTRRSRSRARRAAKTAVPRAAANVVGNIATGGTFSIFGANDRLERPAQSIFGG